ncbi:MAG: YcxB family protein [Clostridia bacterium]|nr:YcxB family protein [Clostridia bacterium]
MNFKFNVVTNDQDYLDYNEFWMLRSPYGKKQTLTVRMIFTVMVSAVIIGYLIYNRFTEGALVSVFPLVAFLVLIEIFFNKIMAASLKRQIKSMKKKGKMGYTPEAVLEFFEDTFTESTPDMKTERKYSAIERISVIDNRMIYIHVNNVMAYILPVSCFESQEQCDRFFEFIRTKCANIDVYQKG